jgi:hypothetical protein
VPTSSGGGAEMDEEDEEALMRRALALSMQDIPSPAVANPSDSAPASHSEHGDDDFMDEV